MKKIVGLTVSLFFLLNLVVNAVEILSIKDAEDRSWTSASGQQVVEAKLLTVSADGKTITLRKTDGRISKGAIEKLSAEDQQYILNAVERSFGDKVREGLVLQTKRRINPPVLEGVGRSPYSNVRPCEWCNGEGKRPCSRCNRKGNAVGNNPKCKNCGGTGHVICRIGNVLGCGGTGEDRVDALVVQNQIRRSGMQKQSTPQPPPRENMFATKTVDCYRCGGSGRTKIACHNCDGTGRAKRHSSLDGTSYSKNFNCSSCDGTGRRKCDLCNGKGSRTY